MHHHRIQLIFDRLFLFLSSAKPPNPRSARASSVRLSIDTRTTHPFRSSHSKLFPIRCDKRRDVEDFGKRYKVVQLAQASEQQRTSARDLLEPFEMDDEYGRGCSDQVPLECTSMDILLRTWDGRQRRVDVVLVLVLVRIRKRHGAQRNGCTWHRSHDRRHRAARRSSRLNRLERRDRRPSLGRPLRGRAYQDRGRRHRAHRKGAGPFRVRRRHLNRRDGVCQRPVSVLNHRR
jgi:hypothetical protein